MKKRLIVAGVIVLILAVTTVLSILHFRNSKREAMRTWAHETAIPEIQKLLEAEDYPAAYALAKKAQVFIPDDPTLKTCMDDATNDISIHTKPEGARVAYKLYKDVDGKWVDLGVTPVNKVRVPVGMHRLKITKEGYQEREVARGVLLRNGFSAKQKEFLKPFFGDLLSFQFDLHKNNSIPKDTISVDSGRFQMAIQGFPLKITGMALEKFFIDRTETTNRQYKEFIDVGGYKNPKFWKQDFKKDGQVIPWTEAMKSFVDQTGHPGPSTWEMGDYPEDEGDFPVSGVSWYEAAAYAEFRGKSLPTIFHWVRAAFPIREVMLPITPVIIPQSNLGGTKPVKVGLFPGIGSSGAKDMAGNVREWCWNGNKERRYCLGGMWKDPAYMFNESLALSTWDRSPGNGFRCVVYPEGVSPSSKLFRDVDLGFYDPYDVPPLSKEVFQAKKAMYSYAPIPLDPVIESENAGGRGWIRETVSINAAYNKERLILHIDLPTTGKPPYKAVIYFPGGNATRQAAFARNPMWEPWDAIPKSGRAFITPIYSGTFERGGGSSDWAYKSFGIWFSEWVQDLGRTIDYLESREDINTKDIALLGLSLGGLFGPAFSVYEDRIKVLILIAGGIYFSKARPKPRAFTAPLATAPILMLNGKYDYIFPVETHQKPMFELIGTPPEHKRHVLYECGHVPLPRVPMLKEIMAWLDKYQGPVNSKGTDKQTKNEK